MRITNVEVRQLALPMTRGLSLSVGDFTEKETVLAKLYTDEGLTGYGEASSTTIPIYNGETSGTTVRAIQEQIAPRLVGRVVDKPEELVAAYQEIPGSFAARSGVECAYWHLLSQRDNKSLRDLFGGERREIPVGESIGIKQTIPETLQEIESRLAEGYLRIKLKIKPGWDIELIEAVRQKWPGIDLTVDANAAYNPAEHTDLFRSMDSYDLGMIEQPFGARDLLGHEALQKLIATPICLDESVGSVSDLKRCLDIDACRIVNIKPSRVGGILESIRLHDYALERGIGAMCGGTLETGIGRAFNIALASKANFKYPADMSPYQLYFAEDLIDPSYEVKPNGHIDVPDEPGLGYVIREDLVDKYTIYRAVI